MNALLSILWWAGYILTALVVQQQMPGIDALAPGFLLALQEKKGSQTAILFILFTLIQEGAGTLNFGMSLLWFGGQIMLFRLSAQLFVADNLLFVGILSASLGVLRAALLWFMCALRDYPMDYMQLIHESLIQAFFIPIAWGIAVALRPRRLSGLSAT